VGFCVDGGGILGIPYIRLVFWPALWRLQSLLASYLSFCVTSNSFVVCPYLQGNLLNKIKTNLAARRRGFSFRFFASLWRWGFWRQWLRESHGALVVCRVGSPLAPVPFESEQYNGGWPILSAILLLREPCPCPSVFWRDRAGVFIPTNDPHGCTICYCSAGAGPAPRGNDRRFITEAMSLVFPILPVVASRTHCVCRHVICHRSAEGISAHA
jgi:hypothetical protein